MLSVLNKVGLITSGEIHGLLNEKIKNDPDEQDELVRRMRGAQQGFQSTISSKQSDVRLLTENLAKAHALEATLNTRVQLFDQAGRPDAEIQPVMEAQIQAENSAKDLQDQLTTATAELADMDHIDSAMTAKIAEYDAHAKALRKSIESAKAKEGVAKSINNAAEMMTSFDSMGAGMDDVADAAKHREYAADADLKRALGTFAQTPIQTSAQTEVSIEASNRIAAMRAARLAAAAPVAALPQTASA